jgi:hypothetical protein
MVLSAVGAVVIKAGHVQPVWAGHPWVFAQAVDRVEGGAAPGEDVEVRDARGNSLGRGLYSPGSAIVVRLYTRSADALVDGALFGERIARAVERRAAFDPSAAMSRPGGSTSGTALSCCTARCNCSCWNTISGPIRRLGRWKSPAGWEP